MARKEPDTAFGWLDQIDKILMEARREVKLCTDKVKDLTWVTVDFVDKEGSSAFGVKRFVQVDERGDMTILLNHIPHDIVAIKITQSGK